MKVKYYQKQQRWEKQVDPFLKKFVKIGVFLLIFLALWIKVEQNNSPKVKPKAEVVKAQEVKQEEPITTPEQSNPVEVKVPKTRDELIDKYFPPKDARIMKAICRSENRAEDEKNVQSTLNKDRSWDIGWCQINVDANYDKIPGNTRAEKVESLKNGDVNIQVAKKILDSWKNFGAWSDYNNGRYLKYLED